MFSEVLNTISWNDTTKRIYDKTSNDVIKALNKKRLEVEDFMALISPAAEPYLEQMAQRS
jgi:2-iminoacetate synthase